MTWWQIALAVYVLGFIATLAGFWLSAGREETAHGASILGSFGCLFSLIWPLVLVWLIIVGVAYALACLRDKVLSGLSGRRP